MSDHLTLSRDVGGTRYTFQIRPTADGRVEVTRIAQIDGEGDAFDTIETEAMIAVSTNYVEWSPSYDTFPAVHILSASDVSALGRVYGLASELVTYSLQGAPPWLQIDAQDGTIAGEADVQGRYTFDVVAEGRASRDKQRKTMTLPAADVRLDWALAPVSDLRAQYSRTGQVDVQLDASNPSGNAVTYSIVEPVPAGVAVTENGHLTASLRIGVVSATARATVAHEGLETYADREFTLEPAAFLHTTAIDRTGAPFQIDQPDPIKHPTRTDDRTGRGFWRLHATSESGFAGVADFAAAGWSVVARYRPRSRGVLLDAQGAFGIDSHEAAPLAAKRFRAFARSFDPTNQPHKFRNSNPFEIWTANTTGANAVDLPNWVGIAMHASYSVSGVYVLPRQDGVLDGVPRAYAIDVSSDFKNWTTVKSGEAYTIDTAVREAILRPRAHT